jgi:hypothetical protein
VVELPMCRFDCPFKLRKGMGTIVKARFPADEIELE